MRPVRWDPAQYLRFADHRARPFHDLVGRVGATAPSYVVDLGCGTGSLTAGLVDIWPDAYVEGTDSSPEMIAAAAPHAVAGRLEFGVVDVRDWQPKRPVDVLLSNAMLQWVPDHLELLPDLVRTLAPNGWIGFQVPGNFEAPSHRALRELADEPVWTGRFAEQALLRPASAEPSEYLAVLAAAGCVGIDVWETTYLYMLTGEDPVFEWLMGTGARPYLQALDDTSRPAFEAELRNRLRLAYPATSYGTILPYRRIFAVARRGGT